MKALLTKFIGIIFFVALAMGSATNDANMSPLQRCLENSRSQAVTCTLLAQGSGMRVGDSTATRNQMTCNQSREQRDNQCRASYR
jgi:hypothetical protein